MAFLAGWPYWLVWFVAMAGAALAAGAAIHLIESVTDRPRP